MRGKSGKKKRGVDKKMKRVNKLIAVDKIANVRIDLDNNHNFKLTRDLSQER